MKIIFALSVAIGVICSLASAQQYAVNQQAAPQQILTSGLVKEHVFIVLNYIVQGILSNVVYYLVKLVTFIAPANAIVNVATLVTALKALGNPTISTLLTAVLALVSLNGTPVLQVIPFGILGIQIDGANLLQFLIASIPPGTASAPFSLVASLLGNYMLQLLVVLTTQ